MDDTTQSNLPTTAFQEAPGQTSATRVVIIPSCLAVVATACFSLIYCTLNNRALPDIPVGTSAFILTLLGSLLGAKVYQKSIEAKSP